MRWNPRTEEPSKGDSAREELAVNFRCRDRQLVCATWKVAEADRNELHGGFGQEFHELFGGGEHDRDFRVCGAIAGWLKGNVASSPLTTVFLHDIGPVAIRITTPR